MMNTNMEAHTDNMTVDAPSSTSKIYKIGDLAREFNVTLRTLRFYEDKELIQPARSGTTRLYSSDDRERLRIALFCKRIGLSLDDIGKILELHDMDEDKGNAEVQIRNVYTSQLKTLERQLDDTRETIKDLQIQLEIMNVPG